MIQSVVSVLEGISINVLESRNQLIALKKAVDKSMSRTNRICIALKCGEAVKEFQSSLKWLLNCKVLAGKKLKDGTMAASKHNIGTLFINRFFFCFYPFFHR